MAWHTCVFPAVIAEVSLHAHLASEAPIADFEHMCGRSAFVIDYTDVVSAEGCSLSMSAYAHTMQYSSYQESPGCRQVYSQATVHDQWTHRQVDRCEQTQTHTHTPEARQPMTGTQALGSQEHGHSCTTSKRSALSARAACVGAYECTCVQLTYRNWLQLVIQNVQLGVGHGGPDGASSHPLKVTPIAVPTADPDSGLGRAVDVVDLCVRQHFTCSLSHTPAQDRHSCSLNIDCICATVWMSVQCQLLMQTLAHVESSNVLNVTAKPHTCKAQHMVLILQSSLHTVCTSMLYSLSRPALLKEARTVTRPMSIKCIKK